MSQENEDDGQRVSSQYGQSQYIPLDRAYLCQDCHCVGNSAERCPACASGALMGLAGVLNRGGGGEEEEKLRRPREG
jgi:hypothetical protein